MVCWGIVLRGVRPPMFMIANPLKPTEENGRRSVKPVVWSVDLEECAKEYHAFAKETENCAEMGDTVDVTNAIKRYAKFMLLQNRCARSCSPLRYYATSSRALTVLISTAADRFHSNRFRRHKDELLVPPFDVKVVWLAHMIRVEMVRIPHRSTFTQCGCV